MGNKIKVFAGPVFAWALENIRAGKRGLVLQGASRSGKTWSILQLMIIDALYHRAPRRYLIVRRSLAEAKVTTLETFRAVVASMGVPIRPRAINPNRPHQSYRIGKAEFLFVQADETRRMGGLESDVFFINEAIEVKGAFFHELEQRQRGKSAWWALDFNPTAPHSWVYRLSDRPDVAFRKFTFRDNPFIPEAARAKILSYEPTPENIAAGTADEWRWKVYGLGERAELPGAVFRHVETVDSADFARRLENLEVEWVAAGLDFGYAEGTPSALVVVWKVKGSDTYYIREHLYKDFASNAELAEAIRRARAKYRIGAVVADSAHPREIAELNALLDGKVKVVPARKGKVAEEVMWLAQRKLVIDEGGRHIVDEISNYRWKERGGQFVEAIDPACVDHAIDAMRYCIAFFQSKRPRVFVI